MLNTLLFKAIVILILVMSCWDFLRKRVNTKVAEPEDKIAAANARERHQWRYAVGMEFNTARVLPVFHFFRYSFHFELATSCRTSDLTGSLAFGTPGIACTDEKTGMRRSRINAVSDNVITQSGRIQPDRTEIVPNSSAGN